MQSRRESLRSMRNRIKNNVAEKQRPKGNRLCRIVCGRVRIYSECIVMFQENSDIIPFRWGERVDIFLAAG